MPLVSFLLEPALTLREAQHLTPVVLILQLDVVLTFLLFL
jgi:hypothetical protein